MSQRTHFRIFASSALLLLMLTLGYSQNPPNPPSQNPANQPTKTTPSPSTTSPATRPNPASATTGDSSFLSQALEINQAEVEIGRLASSKATDKRVKSFADMMVKDHSGGLKKLQALPGGKNTVKLSSNHEMLKTRLSGLSGKEFDREYIDAMASGHREAVGLFEKQAGEATAPSSADSKVNTVARELLPTIKKHLTEAESIQKSLAQPAK